MHRSTGQPPGTAKSGHSKVQIVLKMLTINDPRYAAGTRAETSPCAEPSSPRGKADFMASRQTVPGAGLSAEPYSQRLTWARVPTFGHFPGSRQIHGRDLLPSDSTVLALTDTSTNLIASFRAICLCFQVIFGPASGMSLLTISFLAVPAVDWLFKIGRDAAGRGRCGSLWQGDAFCGISVITF